MSCAKAAVIFRASANPEKTEYFFAFERRDEEQKRPHNINDSRITTEKKHITYGQSSAFRRGHVRRQNTGQEGEQYL